MHIIEAEKFLEFNQIPIAGTYVFKNHEQEKETANYTIWNGLLFRIRLTDCEPGEASL